MTYKFHYTYRITNLIENKHYYGVKSCNELPVNNLGIKYFSSSTDAEFISEQKEHPQNFKYKVVSTYKTRKEASLKEIKLHKYFNVENNDNFYNKCNATSTGFDITGNVEIAKKVRETKLNDIDENGLNGYERAAIKFAHTMKNTIDENGLNLFKRNGIKINQTKLKNLDENGLNGYERGAIKTKNIRLNDIDENGLNSYERAVKKANETKMKTLDENGLNICENITKKMLHTRLNDIDENGLNSYERAAKKQQKFMFEYNKTRKGEKSVHAKHYKLIKNEETIYIWRGDLIEKFSDRLPKSKIVLILQKNKDSICGYNISKISKEEYFANI